MPYHFTTTNTIMETIYWSTENPHGDNNETMLDFIHNVNTLLNIDYVDGTYAEGNNVNGDRYSIHVCGDGDFCHHQARFSPISPRRIKVSLYEIKRIC